ncbi:MAG: hypothetical protein O2960_16650 [Verrucomicrobia bacterium]|nr:hypothetical protein [Verrucomicrobiota bacterium]
MRTLAWLALIMLCARATRAEGTNVTVAPADYDLRVNDRPVLQRGYLPESSPRSIAVTQRIEAAPGGGLWCVFKMDQAMEEILFQTPKGARVRAAGRDLESDPQGWVRIPPGSRTLFEVSIPGPKSAEPAGAAAKNANER